MIFGFIYSLFLYILFRNYILRYTPTQNYYKVHVKVVVLLTVFFIVLTGLSTLWYDQDNVSFHWFDDSGEWLGLDKLGHIYTSAFWSSFSILLFLYHGIKPAYIKKYLPWSGGLLMSSVEWFDGCNHNYGASLYDIIANFMGSTLVYIWYNFPSLKFLFIKWMYQPNTFSVMRPDLLGNNLAGELLKNYNGHIIWVTIPMNKLFKLRFFPSWLGFSIGYGATGMLGGHDNMWDSKEKKIVDYNNILRQPRIFVSIDLIPTWHARSRWGMLFKGLVSYLKIPAPAIEYRFTGSLIWHWVLI